MSRERQENGGIDMEGKRERDRERKRQYHGERYIGEEKEDKDKERGTSRERDKRME
jgi:hypothetical protein